MKSIFGKVVSSLTRIRQQNTIRLTALLLFVVVVLSLSSCALHAFYHSTHDNDFFDPASHHLVVEVELSLVHCDVTSETFSVLCVNDATAPTVIRHLVSIRTSSTL